MRCTSPTLALPRFAVALVALHLAVGPGCEPARLHTSTQDAGAPEDARPTPDAVADGDAARWDGQPPPDAATDGPAPDAAPTDAAPLDLAIADAVPPDASPPPDSEAPPPVDAAPPTEPLAPCPVFENAVVLGTVQEAALLETSGIAESHRNPGVLWAHNDSGDTNRVFALSTTGEALALFELDGERGRDWEDVSVGPGPDPALTYVYIGDVGDNASARANLRIRRFPEPEVVRQAERPTVRLEGVETFTLVYPDGPHNSETIMVDPRTADVFVVVKSPDGVSPVYRAPAPLTAAQDNRLERVALLTFGVAPLRSDRNTTGGDISPAGDAILIRTYGAAYLWRRSPRTSVGQALATEPCPVPLARELQGEAIGFAADGRGYFTVSEGANPPVHFYRQP